MKSRINITIDDSLVEKAKHYAARHKTSLSRIIEQHLRKIVSRPAPKKENFLEYMAQLPKPKKKIIPDGDLKETYYESRKKKYGF